MDYTFHGVNADTVPLTAPEAMQFGHALPRLLEVIGRADGRHGPVHLIKVDVADGFYRIHLNPDHVARLGVIIPPAPNGQRLVAFPLALPMGWTNSPPLFSAATETVTHMTNHAFRTKRRPAGSHRLEPLAGQQDSIARHLMPSTAIRRPLTLHADVYVDDFVVAAQGGARRLEGLHRTLFEHIDAVFRPRTSDDPPARQEPISTKKLAKGLPQTLAPSRGVPKDSEYNRNR